MRKIDLNCDMGELKAGQTRNFDAEIMPYISSCNIACGFHSGSPQLMEQTIQYALTHQVKIGAHPSYNDRENFGRVSLQVEPAQLYAEVRYQISALKGMVESLGGKLHHVKAHGALYNDMNADPALAAGIVSVIQSIDPNLIILALAHSTVIEACKAAGMRYAQEGFTDRRYAELDQLKSRKYADAVLHEPAQVLSQIDGFLSGQVQLANGTISSIQVDSLCLHSDTQGAVKLCKLIHEHLTQHHVVIAAPA